MPRKFFETYIQPSYDDWRNKPQDLRLVTNLCNDINDIADYICIFDNPTVVNLRDLLGPFRKDWEQRCPDYAIVRDIADAKKHQRLNRPGRQLTAATQTALRGDPPDHNNERIQLDLRRIIVTKDDGGSVIFDKIINRVMRFVRDELDTRGL